MASQRVRSKKAPWDRPSPVAKKKRPAKHLSPAQKKHAAARAKSAGRPYPNLVDNMHEASAGTSKKATKRKAATPKSAPVIKDPKGGLTAAGRKAFAKRDGSRSKPGDAHSRAARASG
ncbi:MAG: hypothetical protein RLZZ450_6677 [Pseudomonadota bacterium]|jgi:hypothetical protein